uniref:Putative ovule protein n=1 Tax=Solanum chacoense TaxID=4108 RepID=A0A0V0HGR8_SOLCH
MLIICNLKGFIKSIIWGLKNYTYLDMKKVCYQKLKRKVNSENVQTIALTLILPSLHRREHFPSQE